MQKKNIMYVFNDTGFGGAGQSLLDTLGVIKGYASPVVIIRDDADVGDKFTEAGARLHKIRFQADYVKIGTADEGKREDDFRQSYEAALQLLPIIKQEEIHLIHINSSASYFAAIAALMAGIPYVWHIRELMEEQFGCEFLNPELKLSLYKMADRLVAISDYVKNRYCEKHGIAMDRIYNGLDIARFKRHVSEDVNFNNTFIVAAMITPEKGQWDVIRAVEILVERGYSDARAVIVGNGAPGYVWALKKYVRRKELEGNVSILPFRDDLSELRSRASYAVTASQNEALGRVTVEAMLARNIVIGARSGGTEEVIGGDGKRGFLYELHDSEALADAMLRAMEYPEDAKRRMLDEAQAYAEDAFNAEGYCRKLEGMYEEAISSFHSKSHDGFLNMLKEKYDLAKKERPDENKGGGMPAKSEAAFAMAVKWLEIRQNGHNLGEYFNKRNIHAIAIYGMADLGRRLYDELEGGDVEVKHILDRNPQGMEQVFEFAALDGGKMDVDAVVVTVALAERQMAEMIKGKGYQRVIGLSEILAECQRQGLY